MDMEFAFNTQEFSIPGISLESICHFAANFLGY